MGLAAALLDSPAGMTAAAAGVGFVWLLIKYSYITVDAREPPVIWSKVPFVGHILGLIQWSNDYYNKIFDKYQLAACTLPMLNGKMYVLNTPTLITGATRNPDLSFLPFILEFASTIMAFPEEGVRRLKEEKTFNDDLRRPVHPSLASANGVWTAAQGLRLLGAAINDIGPEGIDVADGERWLREMLAKMIFGAVYGKNNPITFEVSEKIWEFEDQVGLLVIGLPDFLTKKARNARHEIREALKPFYAAHLDQGDDVSPWIRERAKSKRELGVPDDQMHMWEFDNPWVAVTNTTPTAIWYFYAIFSRPDYLARLRADTEASITHIKRDDAGNVLDVTVDVTAAESRPFMASCLLEVQRLFSQSQGSRRVIKDTTLRDANGREYLLKKGVNVQWAAGVSQTLEEIWGPTAREFDPDRWIGVSADEEKRMRGAMFTFGGGKHYCPGRNFATTEIQGCMAALALIFEVEGVQMPVAVSPPPVNGIKGRKWAPGTGPGVRARRRAGWEKAKLTLVNHL